MVAVMIDLLSTDCFRDWGFTVRTYGYGPVVVIRLRPRHGFLPSSLPYLFGYSTIALKTTFLVALRERGVVLKGPALTCTC